MIPQQVVVFVAIGAIAGWLAGQILKGRGLGLVGNVVVGVLGSFVGGGLFAHFGIRIGGAWVGPIVTATVGALVLLFGITLIKRV